MGRAIPLRVEEVRSELIVLAPAFELRLDPAVLERLLAYCEMLARWGTRMSLLKFSSARDLAQLHVLESLYLDRFIDEGTREIVDVGSGAGLPGAILAMAKPEVSVQLIERNYKKCVFLSEVARSLGITNLTVFRGDFAEVARDSGQLVTCRALERMRVERVRIVKHFRSASRFLFLGGDAICPEIDLEAGGFAPVVRGVPMSRRRKILQLDRIRST